MHRSNLPHILLEKMEASKRVCIFSGAGMSAESGISTFRGEGNLWDNFKPEELATPEAFRSNPERVQEWYAWRRAKVLDAQIHKGHQAIQKLEENFSVSIATQNVDRLHQKAGSKSVIELHGNIMDQYCFECGKAHEGEDNPETPLHCSCGGYIRPAVVWFGESLPHGAMEEAATLIRSCDIFFSIGTMGAVYPAASLVEYASEANAFTVEINTEPSMVSELIDLVLVGKAGDVLELIAEASENVILSGSRQSQTSAG